MTVAPFTITPAASRTTPFHGGTASEQTDNRSRKKTPTHQIETKRRKPEWVPDIAANYTKVRQLTGRLSTISSARRKFYAATIFPAWRRRLDGIFWLRDAIRPQIIYTQQPT
jgi:hypothetical protein